MGYHTEWLALVLALALILRWEFLRRRRGRLEKMRRHLRQVLEARAD